MRKGIATGVARRPALVWRMALLLAVIVLVLVAYLYGRSQSSKSLSEEDSENVALAGLSEEDKQNVTLYAEALKAVREDYIDRKALSPREQAYDAIRGMLDSVGDKGHTRFLTPEEVEYDHESYSNKGVGIGVRLKNRGDKIIVSSLVDDSPAQRAGIESGDILIAVDGESVQGKDATEVAEKVEGPEGSGVKLSVYRDGEEREFSLESAQLDLQPASWNLLPGTDMAHLRLTSFSENSAEELNRAVTEARQAGAGRFVLDLRDNEGGYVEQAEEVAALFLPAKTIVYVQRNADDEEKKAAIPDDNVSSDAPLVVLVDEGSASASEILAGALKDNDRAKIIGETTFGAGTVIYEYALSDGSAIKLATDEWLTPNGDFIRGSGIEPDVEAGLKEGQGASTPAEGRGLSKEEISAKDAQLQRAFEVLQGA